MLICQEMNGNRAMMTTGYGSLILGLLEYSLAFSTRLTLELRCVPVGITHLFSDIVGSSSR